MSVTRNAYFITYLMIWLGSVIFVAPKNIPTSVVKDAAIEKIGKNTKIHSHVIIVGNTTIGVNNEIYPFSAIGANPQHLKYDGEMTELTIGENNIVKEHVTIHPGTNIGTKKTIIGDNGFFMVGSHVAHDCFIGDNCIFSNNSTLAGHVTV